MKVPMAFKSMYLKPSAFKRLTTSTVCSSTIPLLRFTSSPVADTPIAEQTADTAMTRSTRMANRVMGWGSLFPTRSMPLSHRFKREGFFAAVFSIVFIFNRSSLKNIFM